MWLETKWVALVRQKQINFRAVKNFQLTILTVQTWDWEQLSTTTDISYHFTTYKKYIADMLVMGNWIP